MAVLPHQLALDDLGSPLHDVTFCVVDLETTGGSPNTSRVTEIGAVKVRGGEVLGELATLVDPGTPIPPAIAALTGITDVMVAGLPPFEAVLPMFVEFARGTALVAHNARFDTSFLAAGLARLDYPPLEQPVVCTAALARRLVRDEVRNVRLATLAQLFRARTAPIHRALADARATVDVLHGLIERAGTFGVTTLEDLIGFSKVRNTPLYKAKRHLADDLPRAPGVYRFVAASGEVLYVGKATDLRARVRSYFGGDDRRRIADLIREADHVEHEVCPTALEAEVRELRAIHAHLPRYNRRGRLPRRPVTVKLTPERFPRLSLARVVRDDGGAYLGPLPSRRVAEQVVDALCEAAPVRRCTDRLGPSTRFPACVLAEIGRCAAPCEGRISPESYADLVTPVRDALAGDPTVALERLGARMRGLASGRRYEEAADVRERTQTLVTTLRRTRRCAWLASTSVLVASRRVRAGQAEVIVVRRGHLVATTRCDWSERETAGEALLQVATGDDVAPTPGDDARPGIAEHTASAEADIVARWLEQRGVCVLHAEGPLSEPVAGGAALDTTARRLQQARRTTGRDDAELAAKRLRRT